MLRLALTIGPLRITFFEIASDVNDDYAGPGASSDVSLAPGFVPPTPWWEDED
jgi:hypothetical protein